MVSGLALIIIILNLRRYYLPHDEQQKAADLRITNTLITMMYIFLIIEIFLMACDVAVLANSRRDEYEMYQLLTQGEWSRLFLGVEITLGGLIPLILLSIKRIRLHPLGQYAACTLILCGILAMRVIIVLGGQSVKLH
jgi:formate-dependent nitrite reductase membrane component NrfD